MASTITVPSGIGEVATEVATNAATHGDINAKQANAIVSVASAAKTDIEALQANSTTAQATWQVDVATGMLAAGTPLAAFADNSSSNPGITLANSKAKAVRWNNNSTQTAVWYSTPLPQDLDDAAALVGHYLVSKSGATLADATKVTMAAFFQTVGAAHDADTDCGGDSDAVVGDATAKTVSELTFSIAAGDVPAAPCVLSFSVKPKDGTLGTDDFLMEGLWFEYTKKPLTS